MPGHPDEVEYTDLFGLQLWPFASIYVGAEGKLGGEARDRIAGFWRALRFDPPGEPDHLAVLLGLYAALAEAEGAERDPARRRLRRRSRHALLWEHLLSWVPLYLAKLGEIGSPFYRAWGALLGEALSAEARELGRPDELPVHLRESTKLRSPHLDGVDPFLAGLLAPVSSGMVLVRDDLRRAALELGLGLRQGERAYVLKALLGQEPASTLRWLADESGRWVRIQSSMPNELAPLRDFWTVRAQASGELLSSLIPIPADRGSPRLGRGEGFVEQLDDVPDDQAPVIAG